MALIRELAIFLILYYQETKKKVSKVGYLMQIYAKSKANIGRFTVCGFPPVKLNVDG